MGAEQKATLISWPESQYCMDCKFSYFMDIVVDGVGSQYVCTNPNNCPKLTHDFGQIDTTLEQIDVVSRSKVVELMDKVEKSEDQNSDGVSTYPKNILLTELKEIAN